jgi:hypothetical protein
VLDYLNLRAAIPIPLTDPPFLDRAVRQAQRATGASPTERKRMSLALLQKRAALTTAAFVAGLTLGAMISWMLISSFMDVWQ